MRAAPLLIIAAAATTACASEPFVCPEPALSLRNPRNVICEEFHTPSAACPDEREPPTWAACSACTQIAQADCLVTVGCRPLYDNCVLFDEVCRGDRAFIGCVGVDRGGPVPGPCESLDATDCSTREDCAAWFQPHGSCTDEVPEPEPDRDPFYQPNNGTCVMVFWACLAEPSEPIV